MNAGDLGENPESQALCMGVRQIHQSYGGLASHYVHRASGRSRDGVEDTRCIAKASECDVMSRPNLRDRDAEAGQDQLETKWNLGGSGESGWIQSPEVPEVPRVQIQTDQCGPGHAPVSEKRSGSQGRKLRLERTSGNMRVLRQAQDA